MIKILILSAIVILSAIFGLMLSNEKKRRMKVFSQFYEFNESLILNLKYGKEKVSTIADKYEFVKKSMSGQRVLNGEDGEFIVNYLSAIGQTDSASQIDYLNERKAALSALKQTSYSDYKKYGSLYFKLSLMAGILLAVLLA